MTDRNTSTYGVVIATNLSPASEVEVRFRHDSGTATGALGPLSADEVLAGVRSGSSAGTGVAASTDRPLWRPRRRHVPDLLLQQADGGVLVVDVKPVHRFGGSAGLGLGEMVWRAGV